MIDDDVLGGLVLHMLPLRAVGNARCVCRRWLAVHDAHVEQLARRYAVDVLDDPSFWDDARSRPRLSRALRSLHHELVRVDYFVQRYKWTSAIFRTWWCVEAGAKGVKKVGGVSME